MDVCTPEKKQTSESLSLHGLSNYDADIEHFCAPVVHPDKGETITNCKTITHYLVMKDIWKKALKMNFKGCYKDTT